MKLFPEIKLSKKEQSELANSDWLKSWHSLCSKFKGQTQVESDFIKKLILVELSRDAPRPDVIQRLIVKLQQQERVELVNKIKQEFNIQVKLKYE